jgi:tetratricopeptide (TPR) repeat protein
MGVADLRNKAKDAFRRKNYDHAIEVYLEALQFEPDHRETIEGFFQAAKKAREGKGKGLFGGMLSRVSAGASRDPRKRIAACLRGLAKSPGDKGLLMDLGDAAAGAEIFEVAIVAYHHAAEADPEDNLAWKRLGEMLGKKGRIQEALDALSNAVRIDPKDQEAIKLRKNLAAEGALKIAGYETARSSRDLMKDKDQAQRLETEQRIQFTPEHAAAEIQKGRAEAEKDPTNPRIRVRLGELHLQRGEETEAVAEFEEALRLDPRNFDLSVRIGDLRLGVLQREAEEAKRALDTDPGSAEARARRDAAFRALLEGRLEEYGRRVKEHPLDLAERFRLGRTLLQAGRVDDAAAEFQMTVRDPSRKTDSLLLLAQCFERKNLIGLAVKKVEEAVADYPSLATPRAKDVHYAHADLLERQGDRAKAREIFERIFEVDITYRDVAKRLEALAAEA